MWWPMWRFNLTFACINKSSTWMCMRDVVFAVENNCTRESCRFLFSSFYQWKLFSIFLVCCWNFIEPVLYSIYQNRMRRKTTQQQYSEFIFWVVQPAKYERHFLSFVFSIWQTIIICHFEMMMFFFIHTDKYRNIYSLPIDMPISHYHIISFAWQFFFSIPLCHSLPPPVTHI